MLLSALASGLKRISQTAVIVRLCRILCGVVPSFPAPVQTAGPQACPARLAADAAKSGQLFLPEQRFAQGGVQLIAIGTERAGGGLGDGVSFKDFEGELAATEAHRQFLRRSEESLGKALTTVFPGHGDIVDVEQGTALEGGEAFEGNHDSRGFVALHSQHNIRCGSGRGLRGKVLLDRRGQALATATNTAGVTVEQRNDSAGVDRVGGVRQENGEVHAVA